MDAAVRSLIVALHQSPWHLALAVTGGGAGAAAWLLSVPGGSRTILEVVVPYAEAALADYLGHRPASFCSVATSQALASRALARARWLAPGAPVVGIGCTASLRSDRPKHGEHRFHITIDTGLSATTHSLTLSKEARDREGEEEVLDRILLNALAAALGLAERVPVPLLPGEEIQLVSHPVDRLAAFLAAGRGALCVEMDGRMRSDAPLPRVLLPGSFNPVHEAHCTLVALGERLAGGSAAFELSVANADKPPLGAEEVRRRAASFAGRGPLWLTHAPTFVEKAHLFPGAAFVVGADTAARILQPRFYGDSAERMEQALATLRDHRCRFLVAGRVDASGQFLALDDLAIPPAHRDLFTAIPADLFRMDVSSTQLRKQSPTYEPG